MKKYISIRISDLQNDLEGLTIDEAINFLQDEKKAYESQYKELYLALDNNYYDEDDSFRLTLFGTREETDKEYETRLKKEQEQKEATDNYNKKLYEQLKKQFENK